MLILASLLAVATIATARPEGDAPEAKNPRQRDETTTAIVVEGPAAPRWTIQPDPRLARRYAPRPPRAERGIVFRF